MSEGELAGKVAIATGATRGIGKATARLLAESGASVVICSRSEADVAATLAEAEAAGLAMAGLALDLAEPTNAARLTKLPLGRAIGNPYEITISAGSGHKDLVAEFIRHVIFDPEITIAYFEASAQLSTGSMPLLTSGKMGEDARTQIFVEALPDTNDNPIKSPKIYAVMDDLVVALQSIIQGGDMEGELAKAQRKAERTMSRWALQPSGRSSRSIR